MASMTAVYPSRVYAGGSMVVTRLFKSNRTQAVPLPKRGRLSRTRSVRSRSRSSGRAEWSLRCTGDGMSGLRARIPVCRPTSWPIASNPGLQNARNCRCCATCSRPTSWWRCSGIGPTGSGWLRRSGRQDGGRLDHGRGGAGVRCREVLRTRSAIGSWRRRRFLSRLEVLPFDGTAAVHAGEIRAGLAGAGIPDPSL